MTQMGRSFIWYHVPKTGGVWVNGVFRRTLHRGRTHLYPELFGNASQECPMPSAPVPCGAGVHQRGEWCTGCLPPAERRWRVPRKHTTPDGVPDSVKATRFQFCFVRRPFEWYRSFWAMRFRMRLDYRFPLDHLWRPDFGVFVNNALDAYPDGFVTRLFQLYVGHDNSLMDFVGRQENLTDDLLSALVLAGENIDESRARSLPRMNVGPTESVVNSEMRERVEEAERWVLETFY